MIFIISHRKKYNLYNSKTNPYNLSINDIITNGPNPLIPQKNNPIDPPKAGCKIIFSDVLIVSIS
jgi:hypothetical protein